ncbi:hypothetical protein P885DRAFT_47343 [Corynascus similis CBS 632.67]
MAKFILVSSLFGLIFLQGVLATPKVYPEVIPGPGLPSLAELNTTTAELYEMGLPEGKKENARAEVLDKRFEGLCGPAEAAYTRVEDIISCYNYLRKLGSQKCVAKENTIFCTAGSAHVYGRNVLHHSDDVAKAVLWTVDHCTRKDKSCAGAQAVWGNGNMIATSVNKKW